MRHSQPGKLTAYLLFALSLWLGGCSLSSYKNPAAGPLATMEFQYTGQLSPMGGPIKRVGVAESPGCMALQWVDYREPIRVRAGQPLFVIQGHEGVYGGGCKIAYSFTPEEGQKYISEFVHGTPQCRLRVFRVSRDGSKVAEPSMKQEAKPFCLNI